MRQKTKNQRTKQTFVRGRAQNKSCALVTKEMTIGEVIKKYPKATFVFMDYGLHCVGCPMAQNDTIEGAAKLHQLDLERLLKDLNKAAK